MTYAETILKDQVWCFLDFVMNILVIVRTKCVHRRVDETVFGML